MKKHALIAFAALALAGGSVLAFAPVQSEKMDGPGLKRVLEGLGFEVKVTSATEGKEVYQITHVTGGYNVHMSASFSGSKNYIYLIASLGEVSKLESKTDIYKKLLQENGKVQPCQFYISEKGMLQMAAATDNRGVQAADMKRVIEMLGNNVAETDELWLPSAE